MQGCHCDLDSQRPFAVHQFLSRNRPEEGAIRWTMYLSPYFLRACCCWCWCYCDRLSFCCYRHRHPRCCALPPGIVRVYVDHGSPHHRLQEDLRRYRRAWGGGVRGGGPQRSAVPASGGSGRGRRRGDRRGFQSARAKIGPLLMRSRKIRDIVLASKRGCIVIICLLHLENATMFFCPKQV